MKTFEIEGFVFGEGVRRMKRKNFDNAFGNASVNPESKTFHPKATDESGLERVWVQLQEKLGKKVKFKDEKPSED